MKEFIVPLESVESLWKELLRNPCFCIINLVPPKGKIVISPSTTTEEDAEPYEGKEGYCIARYHHNGGTIVAFEDQITIGRLIKDKVPNYKQMLVDYLRGRGIDSEVDGNDVLCDGFKVASDMTRPFGDTEFKHYGYMVSIHADPEIVNKICKKQMGKVPRGLSYYGITRQDILDLLGLHDE